MTNPTAVPVPVRIEILRGAMEAPAFAGCSNGQRRWWLSNKARSIFVPNLPTIPGWAGGILDLSLAPGDYILGTHLGVRIPLAIGLAAALVKVDPVTRAVTVSPLPTVAPVTADTIAHVVGVPSLAGMEWSIPGDAFAAFKSAVAAGEVTAEDVRAGRAGVRSGPALAVARAPSALDMIREMKARSSDARTQPLSNGSTVTADLPADPPSDDLDPFADRVIRDSWDQYQAGSFAAPEISSTRDALDHTRIAPETTRPSAGTFLYTAGEQVFTEASAARIRADERHLIESTGLVLPPPVVELGGTINSIGRENLSRSHQDWASDPRTVDSCETLMGTIRAENRIDVPMGRACDVAMETDGRIKITGWDERIALEPSALRSLVSDHSSVLPRAGALMDVLDPLTRAIVWNAQVPKSLRTGAMVLRTRDVGGVRSAYTSVSPTYRALDADRVADIVREALISIPGGIEARGEVSYNPETTRTRIDAVFHADHTVNFAAGDVFKLGARVSTADDGGGAIKVALCVWRNGCYNLIVVTCSKATVESIVHKGDRRTMIANLQRGIRKVMQAGAPFLARWGHLRGRKVSDLLVNPSANHEINARAVFAGLVTPPTSKRDDNDVSRLPELIAGAIPSGSTLDPVAIERDVLTEALFRSFTNEPGDTLADLVNAVTRLHREPVPLAVVRQAEEIGGALTHAWGAAA